MKHWTYSSLSTWRKCPQQYKFSYLDKLKPVIRSAAMERGDRLHKLFEFYLLSGDMPLKGVTLSADTLILTAWRAQLDNLRKLGATAEEMWEFDDGWWPIGEKEKSTAILWHRSKLDAHAREKTKALIVDYKSGRRYPEHKDQKHIYAIDTFARFDAIKELTVEFWYLDEGPKRGIDRSVITREEIPRLAKRWRAIAESCLADTEFKPYPGQVCKWCVFAKSKQGPCACG